MAELWAVLPRSCHPQPLQRGPSALRALHFWVFPIPLLVPGLKAETSKLYCGQRLGWGLAAATLGRRLCQLLCPWAGVSVNCCVPGPGSLSTAASLGQGLAAATLLTA